MKRFLVIAILNVVSFLSCSDSGKSSCSEDSCGEDDYPVFKGEPPAVFNEVYIANADYKDEFGNDPGWVEFYNPADTVVNLNGFSLTNEANRILWTFGDASIQPRGYLTVFLSGRDKPNLALPSDSIDLISGAVGAWTWADSENDPPGKSTAQFDFSKDAGLSGTIATQDNSPALTWASSVIMLKLKGWENSDAINLYNANQILLRGYLSKNSKLDVRLPYEGVDDWVAWGTTLRGTGEKDDLYIIELPPNSSFPELAKIYGLRFSNSDNNYGEIKFSFNSITAQKRGGNVHVSFELAKKGGKLFLMDSIGQIRDSIAYPAEVKGLSYARQESGGWALSKPPTPNAANSNEVYTGQAPPPAAAGIPRSGYFEKPLSFTLATEAGHIIRCDTTGALPSENSALKSGDAIHLTKTTVLRCAQFKEGAYPSEPILRTYIIGERLPDLPLVSIAVNPKDMFDSTTGLYAKGPNASSAIPYYGANFWRDDELPIQVDFFESGARLAWSYPAELKIFGNYSRSNPKKSVVIRFREKYGQKNLNYSLFPSHPNLKKFKSFILRNNGNNFGKDYIRDMMMSSLTEGLEVDYQKGRSVIVYYNGEYFGIHNLRERSNAHYFETNYGIDKNSLDLVKANGNVSRGSDADYQDILRWLGGVALNDENLEQLKKRIDLDNYTNYLQSEIYFLNKDWPGNNLKRWRPNSPASKWKWIIYDTDFGFGSFDEFPNIKIFDFVTALNGPDWPNPPHSTLILRKLLENENYKTAFINRFSVLLATYFAPAKVEERINALMAPIANEIPLDQNRWRLNANSMNREFELIRNFGRNRSAQMHGEMEDFFGLEKPAYNLTLSKSGSGQVLVHNLPLPNENATFKAYKGKPVLLKAVPGGRAKFSGWSDGVTEAERTVDANGDLTLGASFN